MFREIFPLICAVQTLITSIGFLTGHLIWI